jgi:NAD(P)-dependent dehydrogenase (short-subunit alcohol dehydrogenase family)
MFVTPLFYQSEFQSFIFLISNIFFVLFTVCFVQSFSFFSFLLYSSVVLFICRKIAHRQSYNLPENTDLTGQTIIVTGAASGIGRVSAVEFAKLGAKVIVGIRVQSRAEQIAQTLESEAHIIGTGKIIGYDLDLSKLSVVKNFADKILEHEQHVNILLNNAGTAHILPSLTSDGLEIDFGTNHIGHFYLTKLLLPLLIRSKARIVNVSSIGHCFVDNRINYEFPSSLYDPKIAYGQSKLAQIWHASELQQRYGQQGINAYSLHPGMIFTELTRQQPKLFVLIYQLILLIIGKSLYQGAQTSLYCSLSNQAKPGQFHGDCKDAKTSPLAYNTKLAKECWEFSEKIIDEKTKYL